MANLYDLNVKKIDGTELSLSELKGKTLLIVNTASQCGFTPQYEGLNNLYKKFKDRGLVVLGFPCNQFGKQEPGNAEEIMSFCKLKYDVEFPMFAKVEVNGKNEHPLYALLKSEAPGLLGTKAIKWNFTKFLVSPTGKIERRYAPIDTPAKLEKDVLEILPPKSTEAQQ
jgi:glutathione peroxidase